MQISKFAIQATFMIAGVLTAAVSFADTVYLNLGGSSRLPSCGGSVQVTRSGNGSGEQVNLVFKNVAQCSNFDIVSSLNGMESYENKKLQGSDGSRSGSFTIPKRMIDNGTNGLRIRVKSNSGAHQDDVVVYFNAAVGHGGGHPVQTVEPVPVGSGSDY